MRDCSDAGTRPGHLDEAVKTLATGGLVVFPTDTVYGIAADAFTPKAVTALLNAKGRGRQMPPPVLIGDLRTLDGLATEIPQPVRDLVAEFWPGPLTVILTAQPSLHWDLGETHGTVALRMPDNEIALELLRRTGPLAVSSANKTGQDAAVTCADAAEQLKRAVRLYLDGGATPGAVPSTIVDATGPRLRIVREGVLTAEELGSIAPELLPENQVEEPADEPTDDEPAHEEPADDEAADGERDDDAGGPQDGDADLPDAETPEADEPDPEEHDSESTETAAGTDQASADETPRGSTEP
ncbi:tRNA threonylcarbamoyl adenosine modification protein, Sua5/YciO/YrdC/YwlC family [Ruania alba]|uniref:L-threonylcarbamoyladenylate synthase n=2 Tax=Ruania alba TaxID=648782 RepID=A0A1H5NE35_9MICO|nr:tRNA threonylcarbamoyl adenosine modification protein, Sua5/YciO/YrdC/YwlC family [Ruania alba]